MKTLVSAALALCLLCLVACFARADCRNGSCSAPPTYTYVQTSGVVVQVTTSAPVGFRQRHLQRRIDRLNRRAVRVAAR